MSKPINTKLHGLLDYFAGLLLMLPWITTYSQKGNNALLLAGLGGLVVLLSLCTQYELSIVKLIPMKVHLVIDFLLGLFLIVLPFVFTRFHYTFHWPVFLGAAELIIVVLSSSKAYVVTKRDMNITLP